MKSEYKRVVTQASEEMLARWILKNLDWSGGNSDENGAFLTSILTEHRLQCLRPEAALTMPSESAIRLACGEMTAQEMRTVKAALQWFIYANNLRQPQEEQS